MAQAVFYFGLNFAERLCVAQRNKEGIISEAARTAFLQNYVPIYNAGERAKQLTLASQDHDTAKTRGEFMAAKIAEPLNQESPIVPIRRIRAGKPGGMYTRGATQRVDLEARIIGQDQAGKNS